MPALCARRSVGMPPRPYFRLRAFGALLLVVVAGVNAQTTGGTSCRYVSDECRSTPCPGTDAETVSSCISATPPCPTGCQEKTVAGTTQSLCALASASSAPYDAANTATFLECIQESSTTSADDCSAAITEHFVAAGCDLDCQVAWLGRDSRGAVCALETTETACEVETVPCDGTATTTSSSGGVTPSSDPAVAPEAVSNGPTSGPQPSSGQGTNDQGEDLGYCVYGETTGSCLQPRCPNDPFVAWSTCAFASPPCPSTCAAKPVAGADGVNVCAVPGYEIDPIDRNTAQAFVTCFSDDGRDDPSCNSVIGEYAAATGCATECLAALSDGPRNEVCNAVANNSEATCVSTEITAPCPDYPPPPVNPPTTPPPDGDDPGPLPPTTETMIEEEVAQMPLVSPVPDEFKTVPPPDSAQAAITAGVLFSAGMALAVLCGI